MPSNHISTSTTYVTSEEHFWNISVLQRTLLSDVEYISISAILGNRRERKRFWTEWWKFSEFNRLLISSQMQFWFIPSFPNVWILPHVEGIYVILCSSLVTVYERIHFLRVHLQTNFVRNVFKRWFNISSLVYLINVPAFCSPCMALAIYLGKIVTFCLWHHLPDNL